MKYAPRYCVCVETNAHINICRSDTDTSTVASRAPLAGNSERGARSWMALRYSTRRGKARVMYRGAGGSWGRSTGGGWTCGLKRMQGR